MSSTRVSENLVQVLVRWLTAQFSTAEGPPVHFLGRGVLTAEGERRIPRCRGKKSILHSSEDLSHDSRVKAQGFVRWERVFIPTNDNNVHWYSACINFCSRRIDIYDSLCETGFQNGQKPTQLRKNTKTRLVRNRPVGDF
jgi:hypothetical protein